MSKQEGFSSDIELRRPVISFLEVWKFPAVALFEIVGIDMLQQVTVIIVAKVRELLLLEVIEEVVDKIYGFANYPGQVDYIDLIDAMPVGCRSMLDEAHDLLEWNLPNA